MSDNLQPQGNFGIQDTMNVGGSGDAQLLNDLMAPETAQADPEAVEPIIKEVEDTIPEKTAPKGKEIKGELDGQSKEEKPTGEALIADFLSNDPNAETEEEEVVEEKAAEPESKDVLDEVVEEETETSTPNFEALANDLFNLGVFKKEGEEEVTITSPEDFLARF